MIKALILKLKFWWLGLEPVWLEEMTLKQPEPIVCRVDDFQAGGLSHGLEFEPELIDKLMNCLPSDVVIGLRPRITVSPVSVYDDVDDGLVVAIPDLFPEFEGDSFLDLLDGQRKDVWAFLAVYPSEREALSLSVEDFSEEQCLIRIATKLVEVHERYGIVGSYWPTPTSDRLASGRSRVEVRFFTSQVISQEEVSKV